MTVIGGSGRVVRKVVSMIAREQDRVSSLETTACVPYFVCTISFASSCSTKANP